MLLIDASGFTLLKTLSGDFAPYFADFGQNRAQAMMRAAARGTPPTSSPRVCI